MACVLGARRDRSESNLKDRGHIVDSKSVNGIRVEERSARSHDPGQKASPARTVLWVTYGLLGVLLAGFLFSLIIRGDNQYWPWLDGWLVCGVELVASALCITRGLTRGSGNRAWPLALGVSLLSWSVGDVVLTVQSLGGATPPTPSLADVFYLGFYPFCYIAVVMFMRGEVKRLTTPSWLDGAIAGLGAAAVCAAFAFHSIVKTTGGNIAATITSLAYPIGDLLLLGLVVGGTAMLSGRRKAPWILLASGIGLNVVGDTFNLFQSSQVSHVGSVFNGAAWPTAIVVMSAAVWLRSRPSNLLLDQRPPGFLLPGLTAASALGILFVSSWHHVGRVAIGLATATLMTVGIRLALSVRGIRVLSQERHRQSVTDDLTGLANRRYLFRVLDAFFADARGAMASQRTLAFLFIDLNRFKEINDSFGHPAGDELLKQLGARLAGSLRDTDLLVRIGGDEFAVVLIDGGSDYATTVAARVTASLEEPFVLDVVSARISQVGELLIRHLRAESRRGRRPSADAGGAADIDRRWPPRAALPAAARSAHGRDPRRRGSHPVGASSARPASARQVPPARRRSRPHATDNTVGARRSRNPVRGLAHGTSWFVTHRPPYTNDDERSEMGDALDPFDAVLSGHIHFFAAMNVATLPPLIINGASVTEFLRSP